MAITISGDSPNLTSANLSSPTITGAVVSSMASSVITSGTSVASTSGTSIDFTSIPSWVKRVTVMFNGVSLSGTSNIQFQLGTGSTPTYTTSGYSTISTFTAASSLSASQSSGFVIYDSASTAATTFLGSIVFTNISGNIWVGTGQFASSARTLTSWTSGSISLAATLTAVRITTVNGTDTFDAGTINILYE